jgi:hypothetical protein
MAAVAKKQVWFLMMAVLLQMLLLFRFLPSYSYYYYDYTNNDELERDLPVKNPSVDTDFDGSPFFHHLPTPNADVDVDVDVDDADLSSPPFDNRASNQSSAAAASASIGSTNYVNVMANETTTTTTKKATKTWSPQTTTTTTTKMAKSKETLSVSQAPRNNNTSNAAHASTIGFRSCYHPRPLSSDSYNHNHNSSSPPPRPWIHVGLPKTGTTSLEHFWRCGGNTSHNVNSNVNGNINVSHHTCKVTSPALQEEMGGGGGPADGSPCPSNTVHPCRFCGRCMQRAVQAGLPPLASCGNYDAYTQIDTEELCYWPQLSALPQIHKESPNATFVLLFRKNVDQWVRSVRTFRKGQMQALFERCHLPYLPKGRGADPEDMKRFFCSVVKHVRKFVASHPTHRLVELDVEDPATETALAHTFGMDQTCWGKRNVNRDYR